MRVEMLAVGDELLDGRVADTNSLRLAQRLSEVGLHLQQVSHVTDDIAAIVGAAAGAAARGTELCVVSGGLGPTTDDLTSEAMAALAGVGQVRDAAAAAKVEAHVRRRGRALTANQLRQADRPHGARLIDNPVGTACGFVLRHGGCDFVCLPGVPREFDHLVETAVIAERRKLGRPVARRGLSIFGLAEADIDHRLAGLQARWPEVRLQYRVAFPINYVTLWASADAQADLDAAWAHAAQILGEWAYARQTQDLPQVVVEALGRRGQTVATAESCTGGLVADLLTDVSGASAALQAGFVAYANDSKVQLLGVSPDTLAAHGAVSEAVVVEMAKGAKTRARATYAVATSGVAGPGGGTPDKPVGTVWLALAGPAAPRAQKLQLTFNRRDNKLMSAMAALDMLRRALRD